MVQTFQDYCRTHGSYHFLLTYSVHPSDPDDSETAKAKTKKARDAIADIEVWDKVDNIDTTFKGDVFIYNETKDIKVRITHAIDRITEEIESVLQNKDVHNDVIVYCALMVESFGECIEFEIPKRPED